MDSGDGRAGADALAEDRSALRSATALLNHAVVGGRGPERGPAGRDRAGGPRPRSCPHRRRGRSRLAPPARPGCAPPRSRPTRCSSCTSSWTGGWARSRVVDGRARLHADLGTDRQGRRRAHRRGALRAAATGPSRRAGRDPPGSRADSLEDAARRLDELLVAPFVGRHPPTRPLVICPTGPLHALPWSALPSCVARAVSVVPALAAISSRRRPVGGRGSGAGGRPRPRRRAGGAAGAVRGLPVGTDVHRARSRPSTTCSPPSRARTSPTSPATGRFRIDNPMFSSLQLADGAMTVFDLEKLRRAPRLVVLAACDVGTAAVSAGDELLGLAAALQRAGTTTVVASLVPVPDDAVVDDDGRAPPARRGRTAGAGGPGQRSSVGDRRRAVRGGCSSLLHLLRPGLTTSTAAQR